MIGSGAFHSRAQGLPVRGFGREVVGDTGSEQGRAGPGMEERARVPIREGARGEGAAAPG